MDNRSLPLGRFTVLDLTRVRAGPTCVRQLADWGANVLKVELPESVEGNAALGGPRHGSDFQNLHRNKRSITLNLKEPEGLQLFKWLVAKADVVMENYRPDVKYRISGFGEDGPYQECPGFDQIAQGMGGLMSITGIPGQGPVRAGIPIADLCAGLFCAMGILTALLEREVSGKGQWVKTSLLQAQIFMLDFQATRWLMEHEVPPRMTQTVQHPGLGPIQLVGQPFTLSQHANALRTAPPERGQDTVAVLTELGLSAEEIAHLWASEII